MVRTSQKSKQDEWGILHSELEQAESHLRIIKAQRTALVEHMRSKGHLRALSIWQYVLEKPGAWHYRKADIMTSLGLTEWKYREAIKQLRALGLYKNEVHRDPVTGVITSSINHFFDTQNTYTIKNERYKSESVELVDYVKFLPKCDGPSLKKFNEITDVRYTSHIDSPCSSISSYSIEEVRNAIPHFSCGDSPIEQRMAFTEQFDGNMVWQTFDDNADRKSSKLVRVLNGDFWDVQDKLESLNESGAGVFVAVNEMTGSKRSNAETKRVRYLIADFDGVDPRPAFKDKPHMIVESSEGKFHCYWRICDCPLDAYSKLQSDIIRKYGSDVSVKDLARVLRVPGFIHAKVKDGVKSEPFITRVCYIGDHPPLTYSEAIEMFPPEPVKPWSAQKYREQATGDFRGKLGTGEGGRNNHLARRIGGMINAGRDWAYIEMEAMREAMACSPPLPEPEVREVLKSMRRYF